jgi:hypothetical protein
MVGRTMQTARKSTGYTTTRAPPVPDPPRARGIPSLATYEVPVPEILPEVQKRTTRVEALRIRNNVSSTKEVPRATNFNFLDLPAELRVRIYEMCVSVSAYITYDERDFCTCGQEHLGEPSAVAERGCKYVSKGRGRSKPRRPGCYYPVEPNYINFQKWDIPRTNRLIRNEALPIFYRMNDFVFEDCDCFKLTHWIFNVVHPDHLKHIKSITWDGLLNWDSERPNLEDNTFLQMSSIVMLMRLKILGKCKLRLMSDEDSTDTHYACILHDKITSLVARKGLTAVHAENELSTVDELEVNGLVYSIAKKLSVFCDKLCQVRALTYRPPGLGGNSDWKCNCDCAEFEKRNMVAWLGKKFLSNADGST